MIPVDNLTWNVRISFQFNLTWLTLMFVRLLANKVIFTVYETHDKVNNFVISRTNHLWNTNTIPICWVFFYCSSYCPSFQFLLFSFDLNYFCSFGFWFFYCILELLRQSGILCFSFYSLHFHVSYLFLFLKKTNCITFMFQLVIYLISRTTMIDITETAPMVTPIVVPTESNKINIIQKWQCNSVTMKCNWSFGFL